jgi:hypothetical protein
MKSLKALGLNQQLSILLNNNSVQDQEWVLNKSRLLFENGKFEQALDLLESGRDYPAQYADKESVDKEVIFYKAMCLTKLYESRGGTELLQRALDKWYEVKMLYKSQQTHTHYETSNLYIRRLYIDRNSN